MTLQQPDGSDGGSHDPTQSDADHVPDGDRAHRYREHAPHASSAGGQISEAGGASLNAETSQGGADAVPDTHG